MGSEEDNGQNRGKSSEKGNGFEFGLKPQPKLWDSYVNKWYKIRIPNHSKVPSGMIVRVDYEEGYFFLNPFEDMVPEDGRLVRKLVHEECPVPMREAILEPTSQKDIETWCALMNKIEAEENGKKSGKKRTKKESRS